MIPKFRVWSQSRKRMFNVTLMEWDEIRFCVTGYPTNRKQRTGISGMSEDMILMQAIGLKDSRGTEIFEGDIVRFERSGLRHVEVSSRIGQIKRRRKDSFSPEDFRILDTGNWWCDQFTKNIKVIGNIHENPELLNKEATS